MIGHTFEPHEGADAVTFQVCFEFDDSSHLDKVVIDRERVGVDEVRQALLNQPNLRDVVIG